MSDKVKEFIYELLETIKKYHKTFELREILQILDMVKSIETTYIIKTIDEKENQFEKYNPKDIKSF